MAENVGNIGGLLTPRENLIPNIQSAYGAIIQNAPDYQYFAAPLSNQGRTTASYGTQNQLVVAPDTGVRLVNNATGEVVFSGSGYGGAQQAIDAATALSSSAGGKANWDIQITRPGSTNFETVSTERPDDVVGKIAGLAADIGLPVLASAIVPGAGLLGTVLPAAGGSALSSVAQGRSLQDTLLRAGLAGAGAGLGEAIFTPGVDALGNSISNTASNAINTAYQAAQQGAGSALGSVYGSTIGSSLGSAAGSAAGAAGAGLVDDIIVNAMRKAGPSFLNSVGGSLASSVVPSFFDSAQLETMQMDGGTKADTNTVTDGGELIITGRQPTNILPSTIGGTAVSQVLSEAAKANAEGATNSQNDRITPTAAETAALNAGAGGGGVLGTGLSVSQLAALTGLGVNAIQALVGSGGSGATGVGTPYVSPFGGAGGTMAGDFRANPNIQNYEQYGFGGEASFFRPEYYNLVSSGSKMGYAAPVTTSAANPVTTTTTPSTIPATTTTTSTGKPTLLPNMVSSLGADATLNEIETALTKAKTAEEARAINPGTVYFNIDQGTANSLGNQGLIGSVMSMQQLQQAMAEREKTDPNRYATNLYEQIGQQLSGGLLNIDQARGIQEQIRQQLVSSPNVTTQSLQGIYDTAMQKYKPLI